MITVPAMITKVETLADKTLKVVFNTQEITRDQKADLMDADHQLGWLVFAADGEGADGVSIPSEAPASVFDDIKSPSQRLRAVLYKQWELNTDHSIAFEIWYRARMEFIINSEKENLD